MAEVVWTRTYDQGDEWKKFKVPNNVTKLTIELRGGGSGTRQGGYVKAKLRVNDKDELFIRLGRSGYAADGKQGGAGGRGGGGPGGDGAQGRNGGNGGGGASIIRFNSTDGKLVAVAGGAGGDSGDGGAGGAGGSKQGNKGSRAGGGSTNVATGGGQANGGNGGTVGNAGFNGQDAKNGNLSDGGKGGQQTSNGKSIGGGGGGGGWRGGGGGQAGKAGDAGWNGGGGGGGSSWVEELFDVETNNQSGGADHGSISITYQEGGDYPPSAPTSVVLNGVSPPEDEQPLRSNSIVITGKPDDPTKNQDVRIYLLLSSDFDPSPDLLPGRVGQYSTHTGSWDEQNLRDEIAVNGLRTNTMYYGRLYSQDKRSQLSNSYVGLKFWTNRRPNPPELTLPGDDSEFEHGESIPFTWTYSDPDQATGHPETQGSYGFRWRRAPRADIPGSDWTETFHDGAAVTHPLPAAMFAPGHSYEWQTAAKDSHGLWSDWSSSRHFNIIAAAVPPLPSEPSNDEARIAIDPIEFLWTFRSVLANETQETADLRYRVVGTDDLSWTTLTGDDINPGTAGYWEIPGETFLPNVNYEWQVRAHTSNGTTSAWSGSNTFWAADTPGTAVDPIPVDITRVQEALGVGETRVWVYARGGRDPMAEITPLVDVTWHRKRDEKSNLVLHVNRWTDGQKEFYRSLRPWAHELVAFRRNSAGQMERVWEGPITRISGSREGLEIEAQDVMAYVYRRLLRQGYNDKYQCTAYDAEGNCVGQEIGLKTVVHRSLQIMLNALIYDDPNVLPYLTALHNPGDAIQSRSAKRYSKSAYEEIDDMAANAGLDYTVAGRRIILNDTHRPIGRLLEMTDGDFSEAPLVTIYGMSYATDFAVTNNNGVWGLATRRTGVDFDATGHIELIASQYGESEGGVNTTELSPEDLALLQGTLTGQAERNIANRYPMPVVVRIPDNATLNPELNIGINQLIPGVWIPLRATEGVIEASQWQKLDSVTVTQSEQGERIAVVMSPAPNGGSDPDSEALDES